jgi:hypothetical protein
MKRAAFKVLAAACLAALAGPVLADAYSTATFGNVTVTLVDLAPHDGIAPSITFLPIPTKFDGGGYVRGETETGVHNRWDPGHELKRYEDRAAWQTSNVADSIQVSLASSSASVQGAAGGIGFSSLSVSGSAQGGINNFGRYFTFASAPATLDNKSFILSANTEVIFSVNAAVNATYTRGYTPGGVEGEKAAAVLELFAGGLNADGTSMINDLQTRSASVQYLLDKDMPLGGATDSWSGMMSASYSNLSDHSSHGEFYADGNVSGISVMLAPVPEPASYSMMLGGLSLLGVVARRRRNR